MISETAKLVAAALFVLCILVGIFDYFAHGMPVAVWGALVALAVFPMAVSLVKMWRGKKR